MTHAAITAWLLANWKYLACGLVGLLIGIWLPFNSSEPANVSVNTSQAQSGTIQAGGKVKIAAIPARPPIPCPESKICPPCPEQPAVEVDFGASATGSQNQSLTVTAKSGSALSIALGGGSSLGPVPVLNAGALVSYGPGHVYAHYGFNGVWTVGGYLTAFSW